MFDNQEVIIMNQKEIKDNLSKFKIETKGVVSDNSISIEVTISPKTKELLEQYKANVPNETRDIYLDNDVCIERYLIKQALGTELINGGNFEALLFSKELVDTMSLTVELSDISQGHLIKEHLKSALVKTIQIGSKIEQLNCVSTFEEE